MIFSKANNNMQLVNSIVLYFNGIVLFELLFKQCFLQNRILHGWQTCSKDVSKAIVAVSMKFKSMFTPLKTMQ